MITEQDIHHIQEKWGNAIVKIGQMKDLPADELTAETEKILRELYAFEKRVVLFKPTKASDVQFRHDIESALSYFIGGNKKYPEDKGFALTPWTKVRFDNSKMILETDKAIAVGNYYFTDLNGNETKVEYTFGYVRCPEGRIKIELHHSSIPYQHHVAA
jgi:hypothetical protein